MVVEDFVTGELVVVDEALLTLGARVEPCAIGLAFVYGGAGDFDEGKSVVRLAFISRLTSGTIQG